MAMSSQILRIIKKQKNQLLYQREMNMAQYHILKSFCSQSHKNKLFTGNHKK